MIKSNFLQDEKSAEQQQAKDYRAKALEAICGSMVFVEGTPLYWDIENDD